MSTPDHWCYVPALRGLSYKEQKYLISPVDPETGKHMSCHQYDINFDSTAALEDWIDLMNNTYADNNTIKILPPAVKCKNGYTYDESIYSETITTKVLTAIEYSICI